jgi:transposase
MMTRAAGWCGSCAGALQRRRVGSLYPRYKGGRPPKFSLGQRREIKKIAKAKPAEYDLPFSTWSLSRLADFLVAEGVVDDISHEGLRVLLREEGVTFQRLKTWKASKDPKYREKKARVEQLYAIADREAAPADGDPEVVFCVDEFGPLNLQPRPGRQWAAVSGKGKEAGREPQPRMRATYHRTQGVRHLLAAYELGEDKLFGHVKPRKTRTRFLEFCRYLRTLYPPSTRIAIVCDNYSPHLSTRRDTRAGNWAAANNVEFAYTPTNSSWLNRIEATVHGAAVLRARRDRPRQPPGAGQHDPPVHHLAQQPRLRPAAPPHHRQGKRCLRRH